MAVIEYTDGGWSKVHAPERGSVTVYPDGLLNVLDANGRCMDAKHGVETYWPDEMAFFREHPEFSDDISQDAQPAIQVFFPDLGARLGAARDTVQEAFEAVMGAYSREKTARSALEGDRDVRVST